MLAASLPPAGSEVAPGGIVGMRAYAYLSLISLLSRVGADVYVVIGKYAALPCENAASACAFDQPMDAGSTALSLVSQPK